MINIGVLGSTSGTDLQAVLDAIDNKLIDASVKTVISNRNKAFILERAAAQGVITHYVSHINKTRREFDQEITALLRGHRIELILLIGFMRILSKEFCHEWQDKILNVHPSLLPKYAGGMDINVHQEVLTNGDTVESLKKKVQALEGLAFIEAINLITKK